MKIEAIKTDQYDRVVEVWEASVRDTHSFISEADIARMKPLVRNQYLDAVTLAGICDDNGQIIAFLGTADEMVEMLFVHPDNVGQGLGGALMEHAIAQENAVKVDVNEENPEAVAFYKHIGFEVKSRSELDGQGQPFPILHMELTPSKARRQ